MKKSFLQKSLVSVAAASLISSTALFGVAGVFDGSTADFRVTMDKTTVEKSTDVVNVVVEALDKDGKVDVLSSDTVKLDVSSILGEFNTTSNKFGTATAVNGLKSGSITLSSGKGVFTIFYPETAKIGQDTVKFVLKATDVDNSAAGTDSKVFPELIKNINVINPSNQATALEISSLETSDNSIVFSTFDTNSTSNEINVSAGLGFTLKVQALTNKDKTSTAITYDEADKSNDSNATIFQTSEVTLHFVDGNDSNKTLTTTPAQITGEMKEGSAFVSIPADALTKATTIYIKASTPTTKLTSGVADSNNSYKLNIVPAAPASLKVDFNTTVKNASLDKNGTSDNVVATLYLTDKYGNKVTKNSLDGIKTYTITYAALNDVNLSSVKLDSVTDKDGYTLTLPTTVLNTTAKTVTLGGTSKIYAADLNFTSIPTITITNTADNSGLAGLSFTSSDLTVATPSITAPVYTKDLNVSYNDIYVADGVSGDSLIAGTLYENFLHIEDANGSNGQDATLKTKAVNVIVYKAEDNKTVLDSSTAYSNNEGNVSVLFKKAFVSSKAGKVCVKVNGYPENCDVNGTLKTSSEFNVTAEVNASVAASVGIFKYNATTKVYDPITAIKKITSTSDANISFDTNSSETNTTSETNSTGHRYILSLTDVYGNKIDSTGSSSAGDIIVDMTGIKDFNKSIQGDTTLTVANSEEMNLTFKDSAVYNGTLQFISTVAGVSPINVDVNVTPAASTATAKMGDIQIISGSDYLLTNGEIVLTVKTLDNSATPKAFNMLNNQVSMVLSNPNLITIKDSNRTTEIKNGAFLDCTNNCSDGNSTKTLSLQASNTVGDLTIEFRNTTGSVTESKVIHVVSSTADVIGSVDSITPNTDTLSVTKGESTTLTFTTKDDAGTLLEGKAVQVKSDNAGIASVDEVLTTDSNGEVSVTVTTLGLGEAHITATSEGKSSTVTIKVEAAAAMTISATEASIAVEDTKDITVTNPASTDVNATSSNTAIATAVYANGVVTITAIAEGTATVSITDGTTTKTVAVTTTAKATTIDSIALTDGWNLVGNHSNKTLDGTTLGAESIWTYTAGEWTNADSTILPAQGFWAKTSGLTKFTFANDGTDTALDIEGDTGTWILAGATTASTLGEIKGSYSKVYTYTTEWLDSETNSDTAIEAGKGYWIKK
jgi:hypothetical protein